MDSAHSPESSPKGLLFVASDLDVESELLADCGALSEESDPLQTAHNAVLRYDEFLDLEELQFLSVEGVDRQGRRILRIVGKFFPAPVIDSSRLKEYVQTVTKELGEERFCVVYFHTSVKRRDNNPGMLTLRWVYETLPEDCRQRLEVVYFVHPGLLSRTVMGLLGRFFLSDRLYWKLKYINRIEFLWDHIKRGQLEVPDFVYEHDNELEHRPLMDYGLEADPLQAYGFHGFDSSFSRNSVKWDL
eukprot:c18938_g1_i1 orf=234-968(+)